MSSGLLGFLRRAIGFGPGPGAERQFGAIPYRMGPQGIEFLLITSRRTGRWIFPKGGRVAWLSAPASAAQEAFEEAGVEGEVAAKPAGTYLGIKRCETGDEPITVEMYPLEVAVELDDWPEKGQRQRQWAGLKVASMMLSEPELVTMIRAIAARHGERARTGSGA